MWRTALVFEGRSAGASAFLAEALCCAGSTEMGPRGKKTGSRPRSEADPQHARVGRARRRRAPRRRQPEPAARAHPGGGGLSPQPAQCGAAAQVGLNPPSEPRAAPDPDPAGGRGGAGGRRVWEAGAAAAAPPEAGGGAGVRRGCCGAPGGRRRSGRPGRLLRRRRRLRGTRRRSRSWKTAAGGSARGIRTRGAAEGWATRGRWGSPLQRVEADDLGPLDGVWMIQSH